MAGRKWFVRGVVFSVVGGVLLAVYLYRLYTNPSAIREQVLTNLQRFFPGGASTVDSAYLRLLGGVVLRDLRMARRDDPGKIAFMHVPFAVVYHDKEKLLDGDIRLRKVEMHQFRMHIKRDPEGRWNVAGITGPMRPDFVIPTMVVRQGTLVVEDQSAGMPPMTFSNVDLTIINDPLTTVTIDGAGVPECGGVVQIKGAWNRASHEMVLSIDGRELPINTVLVQRYAPACFVEKIKGLYVEGTASVRADLAYVPETSPSFRYDVRGGFERGKVEHPEIPLPLEDVNISLRATDGELHLRELRARSGVTELKAHGSGFLWNCCDNFAGMLQVKHLQLCKDLFNRLPAQLQPLYKYFQPEGPATLRVDYARRDGAWQPLVDGGRPRLSLKPEGIAIAFIHYPYPLQRLSGRLDYDFESGAIETDIIGYAGKEPVRVTGYWKHDNDAVDANFDLAADNVDLTDDHLTTALPNPLERLARSFRPTGRGNVRANFRKNASDEDFRNTYHLRFHQGTVMWDEFPYFLSSVSGELDVYPEHWEFRDFIGKHGAGVVRIRGRYVSCEPTKNKAPGQLSMEINGSNIRLDNELRDAFVDIPSFIAAWNTFVPAGQVNFTARVDRPLNMLAEDRKAGKDLEGLDINLDMRGCAVTPQFLPYRFSDLSGQFHLSGTRLIMDQLRARHGASAFSLRRGVVDLRAAGGFYADLEGFEANPFIANEDFLCALPDNLEHCCRTLELKEPIAFRTRLVVAHSSDPGQKPDVYWDGQAWVRQANVRTGLQWNDVDGTLGCTGRFDGDHLRGIKGNLHFKRALFLKQPVQDLHAHFEIQEKTPDVLNIDARAPIYGGDIAGQARLELDSKMRYEMNVTASQMDLEKFSKHNFGADPELHGMVVARLYLSGQGTDINTLDGNGSVDVPNGRLYNLPLLLDLLKFLGLRWPDRTAFEEAHASFGISGPRVTVRQMNLLGNAVSLSGKGEFNLDGSDLELDFYPSWARVEQLLPQAVRTLPIQISKSLMKIEMRGKVGSEPGDFRFTKKPLPMITEPMVNLRNRNAKEAPGVGNAPDAENSFLRAFPRLVNYRRPGALLTPGVLTSQKK